MNRYSEEVSKELKRLSDKIIELKKREQLLTLIKFFKECDIENISTKEAEDKIHDYWESATHLGNMETGVQVANGLVDGVIDRKEIPDDVYKAIEVVVRMVNI